ncbi:MAG: hypothetical protein Q9167_001458 [Letrouitia subvulpina]
MPASFKFESRSDSDYQNASNELACWITFLIVLEKSLKSQRRASFLKLGSYHFSNPDKRMLLDGTTLAVTYRITRSWDFMPPEVVRPFASTTVSDIAIIALRMGMSWKVFKPEDGAMEAEGNRQSMSSTLVRALGILLRYTYTPQGLDSFCLSDRHSYLGKNKAYTDSAELLVETAQADRMWFGILPSNIEVAGRHGVYDFPIGERQSVYEVIMKMDPSGDAKRALERAAPSLYGFNDIIPMLASWMRQDNTLIRTVPAVTYDVVGSTCYEAAYHAFHNRLVTHAQQVGDSRPIVKSVLTAWDELEKKFHIGVDKQESPILY